MRTLTIFLFAVLLAPAASGQDLCESQTDEFTQEKSVKCKYDTVPVEEHPVHRLGWARAMVMAVEDSYILAFGTKSESWNFLDTDEIYALIDGERFEWDLYEIRTETEGRGVREVHGMVLSRDELDDVAEASRIRVKYGGAVLDLSGSTIQEQAQETQELVTSGV